MIKIGENMNYLVVVAHPDDEVLGAGATMYKYAKENNNVNVCVLSGQAAARTLRPTDEELQNDLNDSNSILGVKKIIEGDFPNIQLNNVPHLHLVQFIEKAIKETEAEVVITHHPGDLNNDHLHTSLACQAAIRLFQRNPEVKPVKELWFMEVPSASDWGLNSSLRQFQPNTYVEVGKEGVEKKLQALSTYRGVMRDYPHPRSNEVIEGLAAYRGGQSGLQYAEAFECVFRRIV